MRRSVRRLACENLPVVCVVIAVAAGCTAGGGEVVQQAPGDDTGAAGADTTREGEASELFGESPDWEEHTSSEQTDEEGSGSIASPSADGVRRRRRMDVDQLDASIRRVTGGIGWEKYDGESRFAEFSQTLGKPDFADSTKEEMKPTAVFQKFLGDAAVHVCRELTDRERTWSEEGKSPEKRRLLMEVDHEDTPASAPRACRENLQQLLQNFHGRRVGMDSPALDNWDQLFRRAYAEADEPTTAWRTVCVALIQHPDFYTY